MIAGQLEIVLLANMARLQADMDKAKGAVGGAMSSVVKSVEQAKNALAGLGVGLGVGAFASLIKSTIDAADNLNDLSKSTSIAVEQLAGLKLAAKQAGGDLDSIAASINKLSVNMGKDAEKFKALGVSAKDPLEAFKQLSDVFVSIKDPQLRAAVGAAALGKSWSGAAPLLAEGSVKIQEMVDKGAKLSGMTKEMAENSDAFNDKLAELVGTGGLMNGIVAPLLPLFNTLADGLLKTRDNTVKLDSSFNPLLETAKAVVVLFGNVSYVLKTVGNEMGGMAAQMAALAGFDFKGFSAIGDSIEADAASGRAAFDKWEAGILAIGTAAGNVAPVVAKLTAAEIAAARKAADAAAARAAAFLKESKEKKDAVDKQIKAYADLIAKINEKIEIDKLEAALGRKLNEEETQAIEIKKLVEKGTISQAQAESALTKEKIKALALANDAKEAAFAIVEANKAFIESERQRVAQMESGNKSALENNQSLKDEIELIGLTDAAQQAVIQARLSSAIAIKEEDLARMQGVASYTKEQSALEEQIRLMKEKLGLQNQKFERNVAVEEAKKADAEWTKFYDSIYNGLTDSLYRGFEAGKGFFKSFWDGIKNLFKTTVLKLAVQGVMSMTGLGGLTGAANAATGGGGIGNIASLASNASSLFTVGSQVLAGGMSVANALGTVAANVTGTGLSGLLATNGAFGTAAAGSASAAAGSVTSALAAIGPVGWAAMAVLAVAAIASGRGETRSGASYIAGADGGAIKQMGPSGGELAGAESRALFEGAQGIINRTLTAVGSKAVLSGFVAGLESSKNGKGFAYAGGQIDGVGFGESGGRDGRQFGFSSMNAEQAITAYALNLKQATLQALQAATDLPKVISNQLVGVNIEAMDTDGLDKLAASIESTITAVGAMRAALDASMFANLKGLSFDTASGLVAAAGGMDKLQASLSSYFDNFYTEEEKRLNTVKQINAATAGSGLDAATATLASFRAIVDAQDLTTESGRNTYAALLNVAGAFAQITPAAVAAEAAVETLAEAYARLTNTAKTAEQQAQTRIDLEQQLLQLTGTTDQLRTAAIAGMDAFNVALFDQIQALTDAKQAYEDSKVATNNALAAMQKAIDAEKTRIGLILAGTDAALAGVKRAIEAEKTRISVIRDAAQESVARITGVFTLLRDQIEQIYSTVGGTSAMQAAQGNAFINQALATAKSTGYLPDQQELAQAIAAARGGLDANEFATQFEADKAALVMAGTLSQIKDLAGPQLTLAEQRLAVAKAQLVALDERMTLAQQQVDVLRGIDTRVLSVAEATKTLQTAAAAETQTLGQIAALDAQMVLAQQQVDAQMVLAQQQVDILNGINNSVLSVGVATTALARAIAAQQSARAAVSSAQAAASSSIIPMPIAKGIDPAILAAAKIVYQSATGGVATSLFNAAEDAVGGDIYEATKFNGDPESFRAMYGFATGTNYVPRDMTARIHEGEAIVPKMYNPAAGGSMGNDRMERLIEGLTAEVQRLQNIVASGNQNTRRTADAVNGNPEVPMLVQTV